MKKSIVCFIAIIGICLLWGSGFAAEPPPGTWIGPDNIAQYKQYIPNQKVIEAIEKGDSNQYIGYKGLDHFRDYDGAYAIFSQYYIDTEFQPIKYRDNIKVICIGPYAFKPLEIRPQFIRLEFLGSCSEIFPDPKYNKLEIESETDRTYFIRK